MGIVTIVGAGMMGTAMAVPALDNGNEVRVVGTHLDREIVERLGMDGYHLNMKRTLPQGIRYFQVEEMETALEGADLLIGGVSSFGVEWFGEQVLPKIPDGLPVLMVTKGMAADGEGNLSPFPRYLAGKSPGRKLLLNAVGGPCISYELVDRNQTCVAFCGEEMEVLRRIKDMLATDYYHISLSTDVAGVECAVALKNAYALGVSLAIGLGNRKNGPQAKEEYNPQAALFGQSVKEMGKLIALAGGNQENNIVYGAGDLYVTVFGGRTRRIGTLLGEGKTYAQAVEILAGVTLESVAIIRVILGALEKLEHRGLTSRQEFPLMLEMGRLLEEGEAVDVPWKSFEREEN